MKSKQVYFYLFLLLFIYSCQTNTSTKEAPKPKSNQPNIVLIMADDLGYKGIGCFGNDQIKTPNLDQMANEGLLFIDYHSNGSVCTPTRAALLTGRYQQRAGLEGVIYARGETRQTGLATTEYTLAKALKSVGYATGIMGKWHLGYNKEYNPIHYGFDEFYGYVSGNVDFHSHYDNAGVYDWWHNLEQIQEEGYATDLITNHAVDFIEKNKDQPFFLYVPHQAPHVPFQGRKDPAYRFSDNKFTYHGPVEDTERAYIEMVEVMDEGIGKIMQTLEKLQLTQNTLVVFVSDNGGEPFGHNGSLKGAKGSLWEGGHRVPAIAYWKGKIEAGLSRATVMSFDWMPTFMHLATANKPADLSFDGINLSDHLLAKKRVSERNLFWKYRNEKVIRQGNYKLLLNEKETILYDLDTDLGEFDNLAGEKPELTGKLTQLLMDWEAEMDLIPQVTR